MNTLASAIAVAVSFVGALALAPDLASAAGRGGSGASGGGHSGGGPSAGGGRSGGGGYGHRGGAWHGGHGHGGYGYGGYRGYRGYGGYGYRPYWGAIGIGLGLGAVGYYGGFYGNYYGGYYAPYPYYGGYYYDAPAVVVGPTYTTIQPAAAAISGQPVPQAGQAPEPIFYPRNGQSTATTESDRRECDRWASTQAGATDNASIFQRATFACMEGRGYTVR